MPGKSKEQKKKRTKTRKQQNDLLNQKATKAVAEEPEEELGNNGEPLPPEVNEDAQKDAAMPTEFDPQSIIDEALKKHGV